MRKIKVKPFEDFTTKNTNECGWIQHKKIISDIDEKL